MYIQMSIIRINMLSAARTFLEILGNLYLEGWKAVALTEKRWSHIVESHNYVAGLQHLALETVTDPDYIVKGRDKEKLAVKFFNSTLIGAKHLVVVYLENQEGFIVTAFMTSDAEKVLRRGVLWQRR